MRIFHPAGTASAFLRQHGNSIQRNTKEVDSPGSEHYDLATLVSSSAPLFVSFGDPKSSRSSKSSRSQTRDPKMVTLDPKTVRLVPKTGLNPFRICVLPSKTAADARTNGRTDAHTWKIWGTHTIGPSGKNPQTALKHPEKKGFVVRFQTDLNFEA